MGLSVLRARLLAERGWLSLAAASGVVLAGATALYPPMFEALLERLFALPPRAGGALPFAVPATLTAFSILIATKVSAHVLRFVALGRLAEAVTRRLRVDVLRAILAEEAAFFGERRTATLVARVTSDVAAIDRGLGVLLPALLGESLKLLGLGALMALRYPGLLVVSAVLFGLAYGPIRGFSRRLARGARRIRSAEEEVEHLASEVLHGARTVLAHGRADLEVERLARAGATLGRERAQDLWVRAVQTPTMEVLGLAAFVGLAALGVGERLVERPAEVVGFMTAVLLLYEPVKSLTRLSAATAPARVALERVSELLERPREAGGEPLVGPIEEVRVRGLTYTYPGTTIRAVDGVDLTLTRGRVVALVGPSGAGKSTILALLAALRRPDAGTVAFDGREVRTLLPASVRAQLAIVSEDVYLFDDTIRANLAYGRLDATDAELRAAAAAAGADALLAALPEGLSTRVGPRGVRLSAGERQRLAIARALLAPSSVVVFDEATSALDAERERAIVERVRALAAEKAVLLVAHRPALAFAADEVLVLEGGRIVERGPPAVLAARGGRFAALTATPTPTTFAADPPIPS